MFCISFVLVLILLKVNSYELVHPSATNRSKYDANLFYNRVPKCGSTSALKVINQLAHVNGFNFIGSHDYYHFQKTDDRAKTFAEFFLYLPDSNWAFEEHIYYIDMDFYNVPLEKQPNMINIMREPLERRLSAIYFRFTQQGKLNNSNELDLEKCIKSQEFICQSKPSFFQACFFAGNIPSCSRNQTTRDYQEIRQEAKLNIEYYYSVVGLTSHMSSTFKLFEAYLPRFFKDGYRIYNTMYSKGKANLNANHYHRNISAELQKLIMQDPLMEVDMDVYLFASRRFFKQLDSLTKEID